MSAPLSSSRSAVPHAQPCTSASGRAMDCCNTRKERERSKSRERRGDGDLSSLFSSCLALRDGEGIRKSRWPRDLHLNTVSTTPKCSPSTSARCQSRAVETPPTVARTAKLNLISTRAVSPMQVARSSVIKEMGISSGEKSKKATPKAETAAAMGRH